jgi:hypothetical protein
MNLSAPERATMRLINNVTGAKVSLKISPILNQLVQWLSPQYDTKPMSAKNWALASINALFNSAERERGKGILWRLRPQAEYRATVAGVLSLLNPSTYAHMGYSPKWVYRMVKKAVDRGMGGMNWVDTLGRVRDYLAFEADGKGRGMKGDALEEYAAGEAMRMASRSDAPMDPAYESEIGRTARVSVGAKALTPFTQGRNQQKNQFDRLLADHKRTGDTPTLLRKLVLMALSIAGFAGVGGLFAWIYRGGGKRKEGSFAGDYASTALSNIYGAGEVFDLLRSPNSYQADFRANPLKAAITRTGKGIVDLRVAIERGDPKTVRRGAANLTRGVADLLGIPTDQAFQLGRMVQSMRVGPGQLQPMKKKGARKPKARTYAEARRELFQKFKGRPARDWWAAARKLRAEWNLKGQSNG